MGVHGLWRLLDSFGTVIQPEDLKGKRVAIDASIWIAQFRARVAPGEDIEHKILEGFLARILKLLFYGIKPVFVFDGQASASKGAEHYRRMRQRAINEQAFLRRQAKQILMAQVAAGAVDIEELKRVVQANAGNNDKKNNKNLAVDGAGSNFPAAAHVADTAAEASNTVGRKATGKQPCIANQTPANPLTPAVHYGKRRRHSQCPPNHHRRRRRLAPDAVSSRSTLHFLQDVECLLKERSKHEARVLRNALHNTSTSLFMGPRQAVDDKNASDDDAAHVRAPKATPSSPQRVFVVEDSRATQAEGRNLAAERDDVSVSGSDVDSDDVSRNCEDGGSLSDCCAVSSSNDVNAVSGNSVVVQVAKRNALSRSPSSGSNNGGTGFLHSCDLARFLATLPQLSPSETKAMDEVTSVVVKEEAEEREKNADVIGPETHASNSPPPAHPAPASADGVDVTTGAAVVSEVTEVVSIDSSDNAYEEGDEEAEMDGPGASDEESEEERDEENNYDAWEEGKEEEEDENEDAVNAADLTWEPFTQRIDPELLLQRLAFSPSKSLRTSTVTPPHDTEATEGMHPETNECDNADDDDDDFTPVKLGRPSLVQPQPAVVVVDSSDEEEDKSNPIMCVASAPHGSTENNGAGKEKGATNSSKTPAAEAFTHATAATGVCRPKPTRSNVATVPFELLRVVELLDCCGVPYVLSPSEADAQCAFLARSGLVDAVFTEDSDVLVHGATTVLRGFFAQSKNVVAYRQVELAACGITKTVLVALASLMGCDYTDGVTGIGLVGALEALVVAWTSQENRKDNLDSPLAVLHVLRRWRELVRHPPRSWLDVDDEMTVAQFALFDAAIEKWHLLEQKLSFPETQAVEAFYVAEVDTDTALFTWLPPDWQKLRVFAGALGALSSTWLVQRFELARKEWLKREAEAAASSGAGQHRLTEYGAQERLRSRWAFQKQPRRHAAVLSQLRAVQMNV